MKKLLCSLLIVALLSVVYGGAEATEANKAIARRIASGLLTAFSALFSIDDLIAEGDTVVICGTFRGIHHGEFLGVPATGKEIMFPWTVTFRVEDGKITDRWATNDTDLSLMQQLGMIPTSEEGHANKAGATLMISEVIASKVEDLIGIWKTQCMGEVAYMQFKADGTVNLASTVEELESTPIMSGTFWFEGTGFNINDNIHYGKGIYEVRVQKEGDKPIHLSFIVINDLNNPNRVCDLIRGMSRVEP